MGARSPSFFALDFINMRRVVPCLVHNTFLMQTRLESSSALVYRLSRLIARTMRFCARSRLVRSALRQDWEWQVTKIAVSSPFVTRQLSTLADTSAPSAPCTYEPVWECERICICVVNTAWVPTSGKLHLTCSYFLSLSILLSCSR
jgi:hypothetical protein